MTARQSLPTSNHSHSNSNVCKRVCKACDRCRSKKSKCDGANPCGRCEADNAICVFGERKKAHNKVYPKGHVEMLEQRQQWLVYGLQELYRRTIEGQGWPGEPLECESNGHPLTHDLLNRLGVLDQSKGEHFEEDTEIMQQELWRQSSGHMQRQESSDGRSESLQSPVAPSLFSDAFSRHQLPRTSPIFSPSSHAQHPSTENGPQIAPSNPAFVAQLSMRGMVDPITLQYEPQQWHNNDFDTFGDMDLMGPTDYANLSFDDQIPLPTIDCMTAASYIDNKSDYEYSDQFLNLDLI